MILSNKNFIGLPVETKSGLLLGKVKSFEVDGDTQTILNYNIKSKSLVNKLLGEKVDELIINRNQVISTSEEKMVVQDNTVRETEAIKSLRGVRQDTPALGGTLNVSRSHGKF